MLLGIVSLRLGGGSAKPTEWSRQTHAADVFRYRGCAAFP